jgi:hypothetical protein
VQWHRPVASVSQHYAIIDLAIPVASTQTVQMRSLTQSRMEEVQSLFEVGVRILRHHLHRR